MCAYMRRNRRRGCRSPATARARREGGCCASAVCDPPWLRSGNQFFPVANISNLVNIAVPAADPGGLLTIPVGEGWARATNTTQGRPGTTRSTA